MGALVEGPAPLGLGGEGGEGHDPDRRGALAQLGDQVGAVDPGHAQVEHDNIGLPVDGQGQGLAAASGLPDQLEAPPWRVVLSSVRSSGMSSAIRTRIGSVGSMEADMLTLRGARTNRPDEYSWMSPGRGTATRAGLR